MDRYLEPSNTLPVAWVNLLSLVNENEIKSYNKIILLLDKTFPTSLLLSDDHNNALIECYIHDLRDEKEDVKQYLYSLILKLNNESIHSYGVRLGVGEDQFIKIHQELSFVNQPDLDISKKIYSIKEKSKELKKIINLLHKGK